MTESGNDKSLKSSLKKLPENTRIFLSEALNSSPMPLLVFDKKLKVISCDDSFSKITPLNLSELQGKNIKSLFPEGFPKLKKAVNRLAFQNRAEIRNFSFSDRKNKKLTGTAILTKHKKKNLTLFLLYLSGLKTKKEIDLINTTNELDDFLYELTNTGKWLLDPEKMNFTGSEVCFDILGMSGSSKTVKFSEVLKLISSREDTENLEKDISTLAKSPQKKEKVLRIKPHDSEDSNVRYIRLVFNIVEYDGEYVGGIIEDVSEIKRIFLGTVVKYDFAKLVRFLHAFKSFFIFS